MFLSRYQNRIMLAAIEEIMEKPQSHFPLQIAELNIADNPESRRWIINQINGILKVYQNGYVQINTSLRARARKNC